MAERPETPPRSKSAWRPLALGFRTREGVSLATIRGAAGRRRHADGTQPGPGLVRVERERVIATWHGLVVADRLPLGFVD